MNTIHQVNVEVTEQEPLRLIWTYAGYDEPNYTYTVRERELLGKLGKLPNGPYFVRSPVMGIGILKLQMAPICLKHLPTFQDLPVSMVLESWVCS